MKGHIRQRSKGTWSLVIDIGRDPETGKRRQQWHTVRGTKRNAEQSLRELLHSLETGNFVKPNRLTVGAWLEQWLQGYIALRSSPRTAENYQSIIRRHLTPSLGSLLLTQLRPQHLQSYYAQALSQGRADGRGGLSTASVLRHHRVLSQALGHALRQGLVARNVAQACDPPHPTRPTMATLAEEDVPRFLAAAQETPYHVLLYTALYTGLRRGELLGLRWADIDLHLASLSVVQTLHRVGGAYVLRPPKSQRSRRQLSLPPSLALLLRRYRAQQAALRAALGKPLEEGDLFCSPTPRAPPWTPAPLAMSSPNF